MPTMLRKCPKCGSYSLKEKCCVKTVDPHPPKTRLVEKYKKYRRKKNENRD